MVVLVGTEKGFENIQYPPTEKSRINMPQQNKGCKYV